MTWHYAAKKFDMGDGTYEYSLVEVFPSLKAHTEEAVTVYAESPEELAKWLRQAADDIEMHGEIHDI